jgi:hypothetical protein
MPNRGLLGIALTALVALGWAVLARAGEEKSDAVTIDLGGLRQGRAVVAVVDSDYVIRVRMLPVRCFDDALNIELNRDKARALALQALARRLSGKPFVELAVSGARAEMAGPDGKFYALTLRVPSDGVVLVRAGDKPPTVEKPARKTGVDQVVFQSDFFTRKQDYLNTVDKMAAVLAADLRADEEADKKEPTRDAFYVKVADLEERCERNFDGISREIKADRLLLDVEKEEVEKALSQQKQQLIDRLKKAVNRREVNEFKEKSP